MGNNDFKNEQQWSQFFTKTILERGKAYWKKGAVEFVAWNDRYHGIEAKVRGSEIYHVIITLSNNGNYVTNMACDCPYSEDGNACKHMAAVLYALKAQAKNAASDYEEHVTKLTDAVNRLSEKEVRDYLIKAALNDRDLRDKLILASSKTVSPNQLEQWKREMKIIVKHAQDKSGAVSDFNELICNLSNYLDEKIRTLMEYGIKEEAFGLVCTAYDEIAAVQSYDFKGECRDFVRICVDIWDEILENSDLSLKRAVYPWFEIHDGSNFYETAFQYMLENFTEEEFLQKRLVYLDRLISECQSERGFRLANLVINRIESMKMLNLSDDEIAEYWKRFHSLQTVRKLAIEYAMQEQRYEEAEALLKESIDSEAESWGFVGNSRKQLFQLYKMTGQNEKYQNELTSYVMEHPQRDLKNIIDLKEITPPEEWEVLRETILQDPEQQWIRNDLLESEGLYRRLFDSISTSKDKTALLKYEKELKKRFPEEMRDMLLGMADASMRAAMNRSEYACAIKILRKIKSYPNGKQKIQGLVDSWKERYSRRSAMLDELRKAGLLS